MSQLVKSVLCLTLCTILIAEAAVTCPYYWTFSAESNSCIKLTFVSLTWDEARISCKQQGGDLVKIVNEDMATLVYDVSSQNDIWTGLNDIVNEGTWVWLDETTEADYLDSTFYPSSYSATSNDCVYIDYYSGKYEWEDDYCTREMFSICEIFENNLNTVNCPSGWTAYQGSLTCLKLSTDQLSWTSARSACHAEAGDLVKVVDGTMNNFIAEQFGSVTYAWLGLNDLATFGTFVWLDEAAEAEYTNWITGQADAGNDLNCVYVDFSSDSQWENDVCDTALSYICETNGSVSSVGCRMGWTAKQNSQSCLSLFDNEYTWQHARSYCVQYGGDLVKIEDETMDQFISDQYAFGTTNFWIGLNDLAFEGRWVWLDETEEAHYTRLYGTSGDCAYMSDEWYAADCSDERNFVCETRVDNAKITVSCPSGWTSSGESGTCLKLFTDGQPWDVARNSCQSQGADLVKVVNNKMDRLIVDQKNTTERLWIGLNDRFVDYTWVWLDETAPAAYTNWYPGEPDNGDSQDCGAIDDDFESLWVARPCTETYAYVCEQHGGAITTVTCPIGSTLYEPTQKCLWFSVARYEWQDARTDCQSDGGDLLKIVDEEMNSFYIKLFGSDAWIGLNDIVNEGTWVWLDETKEAEWTDWYEGYPFDYVNYDCALFDNNFFQWANSDCGFHFYYVCEFPAENTTVTPPPLPTTTAATTTRMSENTSTHKFMISTTDTGSDPTGTDSTSAGGLSVGAVAGIVLACLTVIVVPAVYLGIRFSRSKGLLRTQDSATFAKNHDSAEDTVKLSL